MDNEVTILDAKKDLFKNRPLQKNECYANFAIDINKKYILFPIVFINKVIVSAEVLKSDEISSAIISTDFKNLIGIAGEKLFFVSEAGTFITNDIVYFNYDFEGFDKLEFVKYKIVNIKNDEVNLKPVSSTEENQIVKINKTYFYSTKKDLKDFKIGEKVKADIYSGGKSAIGNIIASRDGFAIIETTNGIFKVSPSKLQKPQ